MGYGDVHYVQLCVLLPYTGVQKTNEQTNTNQEKQNEIKNQTKHTTLPDDLFGILGTGGKRMLYSSSKSLFLDSGDTESYIQNMVGTVYVKSYLSQVFGLHS